MRSDGKFTEDKIDSAFTNISKTGSVSRNKNLKRLEPIVSHIEELFDGEELLYDAHFSSPEPQCTHMTFTELLSSSIYMNCCHLPLKEKQVEGALEDEPQEDYCKKVLEQSNSFDKYQLIRKPFGKKVESVIMLPGTNIYFETVNEDLLEQIVYENNAIIKPHPITNNEIMARLKKRFGEDRIVSQMVSGMDILKRADKVYTTGCSETALYAVMLGKDIANIEKGTFLRGAYRQIFQKLLDSEDKYDTLNRILNSYKSGIFFYWDYEDKVAKYFEFIKKTVEEMKNA